MCTRSDTTVLILERPLVLYTKHTLRNIYFHLLHRCDGAPSVCQAVGLRLRAMMAAPRYAMYDTLSTDDVNSINAGKETTTVGAFGKSYDAALQACVQFINPDCAKMVRVYLVTNGIAAAVLNELLQQTEHVRNALDCFPHFPHLLSCEGAEYRWADFARREEYVDRTQTNFKVSTEQVLPGWEDSPQTPAVKWKLVTYGFPIDDCVERCSQGVVPPEINSLREPGSPRTFMGIDIGDDIYADD